MVGKPLLLYKRTFYFLDVKQKEKLLLENLDILNANKFEVCFSELNQPYSEFAKRKFRHEVDLNKTASNLLLANRLKNVGYITSFYFKGRKEFDPVKSQTIYFEVISCRVKAVQ